MYNEVCSIYPGQDEAQRTKLVKYNYAATPNILQQQIKKETSVHRSDTDAVTTTEAILKIVKIKCINNVIL